MSKKKTRTMRGMVVAPEPRAAEVGAAVLARGGNAFDAAVATGFAECVVDPFQAGIGGMGSCHYYHARTGEHGHLSFHSRAGSKVSPGMWEKDAAGQTEISGYTLFDDHRSELGYTSIMTPGTIAGFGAIHKKFATMDWSDLMQPAMDFLRHGFSLPANVTGLFTVPKNVGGEAVRAAQLQKTTAMMKLWTKPDGSLYDAGDLYRNDDMLRTLTRIADNGPEEFYTGKLGKEIADDFERNGAFITADDLANYKVRLHDAPHIQYRGYDIYSSCAPTSGLTALQILNFLEHVDLGSYEYGSAEHLNLVALAMKWAHHDREKYLGDPEFVDVPMDRLLSKEYAKQIQGHISRGEAPPPIPTFKAEGTTHVTIWDDEGNVVTMTHSLVVSSGVVTPGLGFPYNNSMKLAGVSKHGPNALAPGKARNVGICPTIIFKDGKFVYAAGAPGGSVIISAVVQSLMNILHFGMNPVEAVSAPRIHCEGGRVFCESRILTPTLKALEKMGHEVQFHPCSYATVFARSQLIAAHPDGTVRGASDPRNDGGMAVAAYDDGSIGLAPSWAG
jgi:gamma-glutamyltranspeptidase/glutathione hydrolase